MDQNLAITGPVKPMCLKMTADLFAAEENGGDE